jgi:hypothetical protein
MSANPAQPHNETARHGWDTVGDCEKVVKGYPCRGPELFRRDRRARVGRLWRVFVTRLNPDIKGTLQRSDRYYTLDL